MESSSNSKALIKGRLVKCFRGAKVKPMQSATDALTCSRGYIINHDRRPQSTQKVSFLVSDSYGGEVVTGQYDKYYFGAIDDESVNMKAQKYITGVRERLRHE